MNKKVLVIDDDVDILESLSLVLEMEGFEVSTTPKGEETCDRAEDFMPDIILLDLLLSGKDGSHICRELKRKKQTKHIPIIMMSAHPSAESAVKRAGANDFISKPFEITDLLKKIDNFS